MCLFGTTLITSRTLYINNKHVFYNHLNKYGTIIPLQAKRVGEFIEIRHKILGNLVCLSLCNSVTLWPVQTHTIRRGPWNSPHFSPLLNYYIYFKNIFNMLNTPSPYSNLNFVLNQSCFILDFGFKKGIWWSSIQ